MATDPKNINSPNTQKDTSLVKKQPKKRRFAHLWEAFLHATHLEKLQKYIDWPKTKHFAKRYSWIMLLLGGILFFWLIGGRFNIQFGVGAEGGTQDAKGMPSSEEAPRSEKLYTQQNSEAAKPKAPATKPEPKPEEATGKETVEANLFVPPNIPEPEQPNASAGEKELADVSPSIKDAYLNRFLSVARDEMKKYGIPASVTLGLAALHSYYGSTELVRVGHNHFAIRCPELYNKAGMVGQGEQNGYCYPYFENAWTGFRAHSLLLAKGPYRKLIQTAGKDYRKWAKGLENMGYHPGRYTASQLLDIIQAHNLERLDQ